MVEFTDEQNRAIDAIVAWYGEASKPDAVRREFYVAGYAGTGKSTVVKEAIDRIRSCHDGLQAITGAYTGKAAYVLRKKGNHSAMTIHSMIYAPMEDPVTHEVTFALNILGPAAMANLIVLDECSMIDNVMANDLRSFKVPLLIMGDPGQLPPVNGEGSFTNREPDIFLKEIHRQALDSPILFLADMARRGNVLPIGYNNGDVRVLPLTNSTAEEYLYNNQETQILCGVNRVRIPVTQIIRNRLGFGGMLPMPGERIICCRNNKKLGLFNGAMGELQQIEERDDGGLYLTGEIEGMFRKRMLSDPALFRKHFDDAAKVDMKKKRLEFDYSYVLTVHKSQGSSWPDVTIIDNSASFREHRNLHLYTSITRAEKKLTILV